MTRERLQGYREAAEDLGIAWQDKVVALFTRNDVHEAERITRTLLASPAPPDAIAVMSDQHAAGVAQVIRAAGHTIPDGIAVTGGTTPQWRHNWS